MEVIDWLNSHSGAIIAITTIVLVIVTWRYVHLTRGILKENRLMRLYAHKPEIVIYLRSHPAHIALVYLCVENTGTAHAYDVQFTLDLSFKPDGVESLREVGFLQHGIKHLPRGQKRECFLTSVIGRPDLFEKSIEIAVTYKDSKD